MTLGLKSLNKQHAVLHEISNSKIIVNVYYNKNIFYHSPEDFRISVVTIPVVVDSFLSVHYVVALIL